MRTLVISLTFALTSSCVSVDVDPNETGETFPTGPTIEFDPANSIVPFPNNLLLDPANGLVNLPEGCNEGPAAAATRTSLLNQLNGFGAFKPAITVTFTEPVDAASLAGNIKLYKRATGMTPVDPASAVEVPVVALASVTGRDNAACTEVSVIDNAVIVPLAPLEGSSTYTVALTGNITTAAGAAFSASSTWAIVRSEENPVTIDEAGNIVSDRTPLDPFDEEDRATLAGINLLWNAHAGAVSFLVGTGLTRPDIHLAWDFNTQTTTTPLDPSIDGSVASNIGSTPLQQMNSILGQATPAQFIEGALGAGACQALPCAAVSDILGGGLVAQTYQQLGPNPLAGGDMIPGAWSDPINPSAPAVPTEIIEVFAFIPAGAVPADGWPTVVFGHGITRAKTDLITIGSQLAQAGFASITIDWVAHGSRAIQTSDSAALACDDLSAGPTALAQCYAPILTTDLEVTRDNIRQTVLNGLALIASAKACDSTTCPNIPIDGSKMGYIGQSLGSIIGTLIVSMSPDIKAAVFNVGGVGLVDIVENTDSIGIRCSIVNGLVTAGIIEGEVNVTCLTDEWKQDPGYRRFAVIGRWALDPADGGNFLPGLASKKVLIQEVINDLVIPNFATDQQAGLLGLSAMAADMGTNAGPSAAITTAPNDNKWVTYEDLAAGGPFPGNDYEHGSLLAPVGGPTNAPGALATVQMQTDALTFLGLNILAP